MAEPKLAAPLSLADLSPELVNIRVQSAYGRIIELPIKMMSWFEWNDCVLHLIEPQVPNNRLNPSTGKHDLPNPDDGPYKEARQKYYEKRQYVRLLKALMAAGNFPELAELSEDERIKKFVTTVSVDIAFKLNNALDSAVAGGQQRVESLATSFHPELSASSGAGSATLGTVDGSQLASPE